LRRQLRLNKVYGDGDGDDDDDDEYRTSTYAKLSVCSVSF